MSRPTLDENTIQTYAQYTQALMLLVGAFKGLPDLQGTFNTIYPQFVDEGGEKMRINHGEMRAYHGEPEPFIALKTKDDSGEKYLNLPLSNLSSPVSYARKLCAYNTRLGMYHPAPKPLESASIHSTKSRRLSALNTSQQKTQVIRFSSRLLST